MSTGDGSTHAAAHPPIVRTPASETAQAPRGRLPAIDGLRAVACLTVFLANFHHSMRMTVSGTLGPVDFAHFAESGIGVVMFIVLSGGLLSVPFWRRLSRGIDAMPWRAFVVKRAVRIAPAYYACLLALAVAAGAWRDPLDLAAHVLFVNNLWERSFYGISPHFWTIGMFVQFYVVLLLVFAAIGALRLRPAAAVTLVAVASAGAYLLHWALMATRERWLVWPLSDLASPDGFVLSHSVLAHTPQLLFGMIAGYALWRLQTRQAGSRVLSGIVCDVLFWLSMGCALVLAGAPAASALEWPYGRYLFPWMAGFIAVAIVTAPFGVIARRLLEAAPLRWLGVISYGVYVYHMASMLAVRRLMRGATFESPAEKLWFAAVSFALTVVVAALSYLLLERPLVRWAGRRVRA